MADLKLTVDTSDLQAAVNWLEKMGLEGTKISTKTRNLNKEFEAYKRQLKATTDGLQRATTATTALGNATGKTSRKISTKGVIIQQSGYQIGDFIVQVQSGTNALVAFGQQATQVAGTLTLLGGKWVMIGSVLSIAVPLLTAIGAAFMRTRGESQELAKSMDVLNDSMSSINSTNKILELSITELRDRFGDQAEAIREAAKELLVYEKVLAASRLSESVFASRDSISKFVQTSGEALSKPIRELADTFGVEFDRAVDLQSKIAALIYAPKDELSEVAQGVRSALEDAGIPFKELPTDIQAAIVEATNLEIAIAELNATSESATKNAGAVGQAYLEKRLKALRDEREELKKNFGLIQSEYTALDLSLRRSEGVDTQLNRVLSARVASYMDMIDRQREQTGISYKQGSQMVALYEETERLRLQTEMLLKPAIKFAEAVEASRYDAEALAKMDIDRSLIDAAIQSGVLSKNMADALLAAVALVDKAPELAQIGARMASNYIGRPPAGFIEEGPGSTFGNFLTIGSMGELPTGKKKKTGQPDRIGALARSLATEAEMLESWRTEGLLQIQDFNAKELELLGGHQAAVERLEQEHQNRLNAIRTTEQVSTLNGYADLFGALGSLMGTKGKKLLQIQAGLSGAATMISSYEAAANAAAKAPDPISAAAAWAGWVAKGVSTVAKIKSIGQSGNASAGGSGGSGSIATPSAATEAAPQRVLVEGIGPNDLISGTQLSEIFDRLYEENENRGLVFQIAT